MVASVLTLVLTSDRFLDWAMPGPKLVAGPPTEQLRSISGNELQVIVAPVFNERDSGGDRTTAVKVVPKLEAFEGRTLVASTRGSWSLDWEGRNPPAVTFRPTHEPHDLEIVSKFPNVENAWLAGQAEPLLPPGTYRVRASLRGDGLRKPAVFEWFVRNNGKGRRILIGNEPNELVEVVSVKEDAQALSGSHAPTPALLEATSSSLQFPDISVDVRPLVESGSNRALSGDNSDLDKGLGTS